MKTISCPTCGNAMTKFGKTKAGSQRWRCKVCNRTQTIKYSSLHKDFKEFIGYLTSAQTQASMKGGGSSFRRRVKKFWEIWPIAPVTDVSYDVLYCDAIYAKTAKDQGNVAILIVCTADSEVIGWYSARSESEDAWVHVLSRIAPPKLVVSDGAKGFLKAVERVWPNTICQRCIFHVMAAVTRATTLNPRGDAARELKALSQRLSDNVTVELAQAWVQDFDTWCKSYKNELSYAEGEPKSKRKRKLRAARALLSNLIADNTLFNYLFVEIDRPLSALMYNNYIEGAINSQIKEMWRRHRGQSVIRRIKAAYWWCHEHNPEKLDIDHAMSVFPTDEMVQDGFHPKKHTIGFSGAPEEWGQAVVWDEFHLHVDYFKID